MSMKNFYNISTCIPNWYFSQGSFTFNKLKQLVVYVEFNLKVDNRIID